MNTWKKQKLADICNIKSGKTNSQDASVDGEYLLFDRSREIKRSNKYLFDMDAIILPGEGQDFLPRFYSGKFDLHQRAYAIWPKNQTTTNVRFVYFSLIKNREYFAATATGATVKSLRLPQIGSLEFLLPDFSTQTLIASVLSTYDYLIENNEKRIKILEEMAKRLYQQWFVKFKFPEHEKGRLIDSGTEYGKIPEGWMVKKLSEIASIVRGCSYSSEEIDDFSGDFYIVNLKSFNRGGGFRFDGAKYYSGKINDNQKINTGDIVVAVTDMTTDRAVIARPARVPEIDGKITFSADVVKINSDTLPSSFIYELLSTYKFTEKTKQMANGANVLHLKPSTILEFNTLIPDHKILNQFDVLCKPASTEIDKLLKANDNLSKTRDLLISQLVTGKREIKN